MPTKITQYSNFPSCVRSYRRHSSDDEGGDGDGGRLVDDVDEPGAVADELGGADDGEADGGEGGHGIHQGEQDSDGRQFNRPGPVFGSKLGAISGFSFWLKFWTLFNGYNFFA